mmetsp:Transcript_25722/g.60015  ORF Transcript_25722/g.60015 Transcript_25722/m.60015 type:complete len:395 (-) Transcript_25722:110-1294(-)
MWQRSLLVQLLFVVRCCLSVRDFDESPHVAVNERGSLHGVGEASEAVAPGRRVLQHSLSAPAANGLEQNPPQSWVPQAVSATEASVTWAQGGYADEQHLGAASLFPAVATPSPMMDLLLAASGVASDAEYPAEASISEPPTYVQTQLTGTAGAGAGVAAHGTAAVAENIQSIVASNASQGESNEVLDADRAALEGSAAPAAVTGAAPATLPPSKAAAAVVSVTSPGDKESHDNRNTAPSQQHESFSPLQAAARRDPAEVAAAPPAEPDLAAEAAAVATSPWAAPQVEAATPAPAVPSEGPRQAEAAAGVHGTARQSGLSEKRRGDSSENLDSLTRFFVGTGFIVLGVLCACRISAACPEATKRLQPQRPTLTVASSTARSWSVSARRPPRQMGY